MQFAMTGKVSSIFIQPVHSDSSITVGRPNHHNDPAIGEAPCKFTEGSTLAAGTRRLGGLLVSGPTLVVGGPLPRRDVERSAATTAAFTAALQLRPTTLPPPPAHRTSSSRSEAPTAAVGNEANLAGPLTGIASLLTTATGPRGQWAGHQRGGRQELRVRLVRVSARTDRWYPALHQGTATGWWHLTVVIHLRDAPVLWFDPAGMALNRARGGNGINWRRG